MLTETQISGQESAPIPEIYSGFVPGFIPGYSGFIRVVQEFDWSLLGVLVPGCSGCSEICLEFIPGCWELFRLFGICSGCSDLFGVCSGCSGCFGLLGFVLGYSGSEFVQVYSVYSEFVRFIQVVDLFGIYSEFIPGFIPDLFGIYSEFIPGFVQVIPEFIPGYSGDLLRNLFRNLFRLFGVVRSCSGFIPICSDLFRFISGFVQVIRSCSEIYSRLFRLFQVV
jgi:hypothetical protein